MGCLFVEISGEVHEHRDIFPGLGRDECDRDMGQAGKYPADIFTHLVHGDPAFDEVPFVDDENGRLGEIKDIFRQLLIHPGNPQTRLQTK